MSKIAVETSFGNLPSYNYPTTYTSSRLGLGNSMIQYDGGTEITRWAGPSPVSVLRPFEYLTASICGIPWAKTWPSSSLDYVFFGDNFTAAATRKVLYSIYNKANAAWNIEGFIIVNFPVTTNATVRGFAMEYVLHNTGSIAVNSGSRVVAGSGSWWGRDGVCLGNRIGFGTTVPSEVTQWYEITGSTIYTGSYQGSNHYTPITNSSLLLTTEAAVTYPSGTSYVIEDWRSVMVTTNATATNGGVFVVKGLRPEIFNTSGQGTGLIPSASLIDNMRACYWLADASTVQNTASHGKAFDNTGTDPYTFTTHSLWVLEGQTPLNPRLFKYNTRIPLVLNQIGKNTASLVLATGVGGAPIGVPSQSDNLLCAKLNHGPGSGSTCLYYTTTTRVYRTAPVSTINSGSVVWSSDGDVMSEVPPGGVNTFALNSLMNGIDYISDIDKLIITTTATTTPYRSYITKFSSGADQFDRVWGIDNRQIDSSIADSDLTPVPSTTGTNWYVYYNNNMIYLGATNAGAGSAILNREYVIPLPADWEWASLTDCRLISPAIDTPNCNYYKRFYANTIGNLGGATGKNLGVSCEDWRAYYRTAGITNNSGSWTLMDKTGNLSGVGGASQIQFMFEFRTMGMSHVPDRVLSCGVIYEDTSTDTHYQPSVAHTNLTTKTFAWRFATAWGSTVPTLKVNIYDAVLGSLYLTDNTATPTLGQFSKSIDDGNTFLTYDTDDLINTASYITYKPTTLGDNIKVQANLIQY